MQLSPEEERQIQLVEGDNMRERSEEASRKQFPEQSGGGKAGCVGLLLWLLAALAVC